MAEKDHNFNKIYDNKRKATCKSTNGFGIKGQIIPFQLIITSGSIT